jgi:pyridoxamine 5'-phosphate oxidase
VSSDPTAARTDYTAGRLEDGDVDSDPFALFGRWLADAAASGMPDPNAMVLGTLDPDGRPSSRTVLLRGIDEGFRLFTNRESRKGRALAAHRDASLLFPWYALQRQVIVAGEVEQLQPMEDDAYFASRPWGSRIAARASSQSRPIGSRVELERAFADEAEAYPDDVPRPAYWGGYRVVPRSIEFWQGRASRLHDRILFERRDDAWSVTRLQP